MAEELGVGGAAKGSFAPRTTEEVLLEEYERLTGSARPGGVEDYYRLVQKEGQAALCLSGGGIRSAAFALGVLQALSRKGVLTGFRYLSTVSGGGYIGGWLQRWIHEEKDDPAAVMIKLGATEEPDQIKRLRENSNFLTPKTGLGSNDTWTAIALSLRNIVINWFLFLPMLLFVAVFPNWFRSGVDSVPTAVAGTWWFDEMLLGLAGVSIAISVAFTVPMIPSYRKGYEAGSRLGDSWIFLRIVLPIICWSVFGTLALAAVLIEGLVGVSTVRDPLDGNALAGVTWIGMVLGLVVGAIHVKKDYRRTLIDDFAIWPLSFLVTAAWVWIGAGLFNKYAPVESDLDWSAALLTTLGPLWLMSATLVGAIFFAAFRFSDGPQIRPDSDREWIGRVSGIKFKPMLVWALVAFSALLLSELFRSWTGFDLTISGIVALVAGGSAVMGGSSQRSGDMGRKGGGYILRILPLQTVLSLLTLLFVVALLVLLAGLENRIVNLAWRPMSGLLADLGAPLWVDPHVASHTTLLILLGLIIFFLQRTLPINRFSLNGFYRNRLSRAFLGAARDPTTRNPNPFTGFDSADNLRLFQLRSLKTGKAALYPVINAALNVTSGENLAWQERKAEPFVFTPLFCGSGMLHVGAAAYQRTGAYVASCEYAGSERDIALNADEGHASHAVSCNHAAEPARKGAETHGITLASAISISGAAASPNMGYHSSAATAFLMTLFNLRLGAWLPNPARADKLGHRLRESSPRNALWALIGELSGATSDKSKSVYLSDGGHFENLGIYEMLRRRCRYVLVSDAGADPECAFTDLGGAVRKAKIDLDIEISFGRICISARQKDVTPQLAWAVGEIKYPEGGRGLILYVKPSYYGKHLPVDVVSYASASKPFPHESTADQWFSESQFESYRRLGEHFASQVGTDMRTTDLPEFFDRAVEDYIKRIGKDPEDDQQFLARLEQLGKWRPSPPSSL